MGKKLLTADYNRFVEETLRLPENDFFDYYLNIINEHYDDNRDIADKLKAATKNWIAWYRQQRGDHGPMWGVDDDGSKNFIDPDKTSIPLLPIFGITRHINKSFFDAQLDILEVLNKLLKLRDEQKSIENKAPQLVIEATDRLYPCDFSLELDKLQERSRVFFAVWEKYNESENNTGNQPKPDKKGEAFNSFSDLFRPGCEDKMDDIISILKGDENGLIVSNNKDLVALINEDGEWIGNKQAAAVFCEALIEKNVFKSTVKTSAKTTASLFSDRFKNLGTSFNTQIPGNKAMDYKPYFIKRIDEMLASGPKP